MNPKYKSMVRRMEEKEKSESDRTFSAPFAELQVQSASQSDEFPSADEPWHLYILRCKDGSLYTGIAKNLIERIKKHNSGKGAAYTRTHRSVKLVYSEILKNRTEALIREMRIKSLPRLKKEELLKQKVQRCRYGETR